MMKLRGVLRMKYTRMTGDWCLVQIIRVWQMQLQ